MTDEQPAANLDKISVELKRVIELFSKTASNITADIEEAIEIAKSEEELRKILQETLKNTKDNIDTLMKKLSRD